MLIRLIRVIRGEMFFLSVLRVLGGWNFVPRKVKRSFLSG
jgi:hypothetical protein